MTRIRNTLRRRPYLFLFILSLLSSFFGTIFWNFIFAKLCGKRLKTKSKTQPTGNRKKKRHENHVVSTPSIDVPPENIEDVSVPLTTNSDLIGKTAPHFNNKAVVNKQFTSVSLDDFEDKYLILWFYPGDWQENSATMLREISSSLDDIIDKNARVAAVSVDSEFPHLKFSELPSEKGGLAPLHPEMILIADNKQILSKNYGMLDSQTGRSRQGMIIIGPDKSIRHVVISSQGFGCKADDILQIL